MLLGETKTGDGQVRQGFPEEMRLQVTAKRGTGVKKVKVKGETFQKQQLMQKSHDNSQKKAIIYILLKHVYFILFLIS